MIWTLQVLLTAGEKPHKVEMSGLTCDGITRVIDMSSTEVKVGSVF